jgi:hypothetical protein
LLLLLLSVHVYLWSMYRWSPFFSNNSWIVLFLNSKMGKRIWVFRYNDQMIISSTKEKGRVLNNSNWWVVSVVLDAKTLTCILNSTKRGEWQKRKRGKCALKGEWVSEWVKGGRFEHFSVQFSLFLSLNFYIYVSDCVLCFVFFTTI